MCPRLVIVQVRVVPSPDGVSSELHDKVLDVSSPGVVQVRVPSFVDGTSPSSQDKFLDELVVVSHCPVTGFSSSFFTSWFTNYDRCLCSRIRRWS